MRKEICKVCGNVVKRMSVSDTGSCDENNARDKDVVCIIVRCDNCDTITVRDWYETIEVEDKPQIENKGLDICEHVHSFTAYQNGERCNQCIDCGLFYPKNRLAK